MMPITINRSVIGSGARSVTNDPANESAATASSIVWSSVACRYTVTSVYGSVRIQRINGSSITISIPV
jgi:spore maturation protein SpmB